MNSEEAMDKLPEGDIRFIQQKRPALMAGDYEISIVQEIINKKLNQSEDKLSSSKKFAVRGERFQLEESDIHSIFPPHNREGDFSDSLPHIVLKTDTLPWERSAGEMGNSIPWLVLLLFHEDEISRITVENRKLDDLHRPEGWLESGENSDDQCTVLEAPKDLLDEIVPGPEDLEWLCHIRQVNNEKKEDTAEGRHTDYAVIIGNRRPQEGTEKSKKKNSIHLVSLEGYYDKNRKEWYEPVDGRVQLVSLKCWDFLSTKTDYTFPGEMKKLSTGVLRVPGETEEPQLKRILSGGYTLLRHQMRQGDKTVSLYRGPLTPSFIPKTVQLPITCGDEAVRLYQKWGLLDVSYAAAWQLGRLLALRNREFSALLYQWKIEKRRKMLMKKEWEKAKKMMGAIGETGCDDSEQTECDDRFSRVGEWLGELKLLSGVPLYYILPEIEKMLPEDSIRFFQVDPNWTNCLIDGAFSLGRVTTMDMKYDMEHFYTIYEDAERAAWASRKVQSASPETEEQKGFERITGILIRSETIVNWPGIEVEAYGSGNSGTDNRLPIIRMNRLDDNILICLFEGEPEQIKFYPPAEGLHYDIKKPTENTMIRKPKGDGFSNIKISEIKGGVVEVAKLAKDIMTKFKMGEDSFTSAQFALSLIAVSDCVSFSKK